ncbi:MAG TPA: MCE family protein [Nocardioides sp.]|nr:MCE family protein [Nocardioides sp.]
MSRRTQTLVTTLGVLAVGAVVLVLALNALPDITRTRLPGAAGGSDTYSVQARFRDVLDLVPNSTVRVADVPVGRVSSIDVARDEHGYVAVAKLEIDSDHPLPAGTVATIRSTSLLGEKYVALIAPATGGGSLRQAGTIPLSRTTQDVEVEQLLASLGTLLNGGGIQQLSTITREFSGALGGREQDTRDLLGDLQSIVAGLDRGRPALVAALDSTARLSRALAAQHQVLSQAVHDFDPATGVLARQEHQLTTALRKLDRLDARATGLIRRSTKATVADLRALAPVAREIGKVAHLIPENLTLLVTYPFADTAVPAFSGAYGAVKGSLVIDLKYLVNLVAPTPTDPQQPFDPSAGLKLPLTAPAPAAQQTKPGVANVVGELLHLLLPGKQGAP